MTDLLTDTLSRGYLLLALVAALVAGIVVRRSAHAVAIGMVVAGFPEPRFVLNAAVIAVAGAIAPPKQETPVGVGAVILAVGATYACLPDTEATRAMFGATLAAGALFLLRPADGGSLRVPIAAGLAATAVLDGAGRASATAAGLAIAGLLASAALGGGRLLVVRAALVTVAFAICSRVFGIATEGSLAIAGSLVLAAAVSAATWRLAGDRTPAGE